MIDDAQVQPNEPASSTAPRKRGKLTFVDLAGSERLKRCTHSAKQTASDERQLTPSPLLPPRALTAPRACRPQSHHRRNIAITTAAASPQITDLVRRRDGRY